MGSITPNRPTAALLILVLAVVLVGLASAVAFDLTDSAPSESPVEADTGNRSLVTSVAGPGCIKNVTGEHGGWVHTVANGDADAVTFDVTVHHDRNQSASVSLAEAGTDAYELRIVREGVDDHVDDRGRLPTGDATCPVGTRIIGAGSLPTDHETLTVTVDGEPVQQIERDGTFPELRPLPDPIER